MLRVTATQAWGGILTFIVGAVITARWSHESREPPVTASADSVAVELQLRSRKRPTMPGPVLDQAVVDNRGRGADDDQPTDRVD